MIRVIHLRDTDEIGGPGKTILETMTLIDPQELRLHLGVFAPEGANQETAFTKEARRGGLSAHTVRGSRARDPGEDGA